MNTEQQTSTRERIAHLVALTLLGGALLAVVVAVFFGSLNKIRPLTYLDLVVFVFFIAQFVFAVGIGILASAMKGQAKIVELVTNIIVKFSVTAAIFWVIRPSASFGFWITALMLADLVLLGLYVRARFLQNPSSGSTID